MQSHQLCDHCNNPVNRSQTKGVFVYYEETGYYLFLKIHTAAKDYRLSKVLLAVKFFIQSPILVKDLRKKLIFYFFCTLQTKS
jgi:hypothetical protein